jgi:hypothetical protein
MDRKEVQERVDELMHQLDTGQIDRPLYVEGMAKLQYDAGNDDA